MTYIIAEIGVNHDGALNKAKKLVDAAAKCGADAAKFQIFISEDIVSPQAAKADYQTKNKASGKTQYEMLKKLELSFAQFRVLKKHCESKKIDFLASVFGLKELAFYADELGCEVVKFGSGELTNAPLLLSAAQKGLRVILSTGMATLDDIEFALGVLAHGYAAPKKAPISNSSFIEAYKSKKGQEALIGNVAIMQCTTDYPCKDEDVNLRAMQIISDSFGLAIGFSDHSTGFGSACVATAMGAELIEKHITLNRSDKGPDHKASLDIPQFTQYVNEIRSVEKALGSGEKTVSAASRKIADIACKKIVAAAKIKKGELYTTKNLTTRRASGNGLKDKEYFNLIGKKSVSAYNSGDVIAR